jgi:pyruvate dehydrogenase E1 component alpha subunit
MVRCAEALRLAGVAADRLAGLEEEARAEIARAVAAAERAPWPEPELAWADVQDVGGAAWPR